jgi:DNA gyrase subunit B
MDAQRNEINERMGGSASIQRIKVLGKWMRSSCGKRRWIQVSEPYVSVTIDSLAEVTEFSLLMEMVEARNETHKIITNWQLSCSR